MGLFGMIGDVLGTMHDMKELGKIQDEIEAGVEALVESGKCPEALKTVFDKVKNVPSDAKVEESLGILKDFAKALADNANLLPEDIQKKVSKFADVVKDLGEKTEDLERQTGIDL